MPIRWRSSFFYFFFPILGGTFASLFLSVYYSYVLRTFKQFRLFFLKSAALALMAQWTLYSTLAQQMVAPFTLRDLLNNHQAALGSSLLGLFLACAHLFLHKKRCQKDLLVFVSKEWPLIPSLLCCALGGLLNIGLVWFVYLWVDSL